MFSATLSNLPNVTVMPLDDTLAYQALKLAAQHGLRGADAVYAAVAMQADWILITLGNEHLTRLLGIVKTRAPTAALADLTTSPSPVP